MRNIESWKIKFRSARLVDWLSIKLRYSEVCANVKLYSGVKLIRSFIGSYSYIGPRSKLYKTTVGSYTSIGPECMIGLGIHPTYLPSTAPIFYKSNNSIVENASIIIGSDVWIGARVMVADGLRIGNGAIVAAGAVVVQDIPPYEIWGGVPAKKIRRRFPDESIERAIAESEWWELGYDRLNERAFNIDMRIKENVEKFKESYRQG